MNEKPQLLISAIWLLALLPATAKADGLFTQQPKTIELGNQHYVQQKYDQALEYYNQAGHKLQKEPKVHFNRGAALFKLGRYDPAQQAFKNSASSEDPDLRKKIFYNLGNTHFAQGNLKDAKINYRKALEIDPNYDDARFNLELALRKTSKSPSEPEDQASTSTRQNERESDSDDSDTSSLPKNPQGTQTETTKLEEQNQEEPSGDLSPMQIQNLLNAMGENEKPFQMNRLTPSRLKRKDLEKDW